MHRRFTPIIATVIAATIATSAFATTSTWTNTGSGTWSDSTNWDTNPAIPNGIDDVAIFPNSPLQPSNITLDNSFTLGALSIDAPFGLTFQPSNGSLTFATSSGSASLTINPATGVVDTFSVPLSLNSNLSVTNNLSTIPGQRVGDLLISGNLSGDGALTLNGIGITTLEGTNSGWTGRITINGGILRAETATSLGSGANTVLINPGGALTIDTALSASQNITLAGGTLLTGSSGMQISVGGQIHVTTDSAFAASTAAGQFVSKTLTINSIISGTANLTIASSTLAATATNALSGNIFISGGTLTVSTTGSFLNVPQFNVSAGALSVSTPAGSNPVANSVQSHSVLLTGGTLALAADLNPAQFLNASSIAGGIAINVSNFTNAGTNTIDMNTLPGGDGLRLGSTIPSINPGSIAGNVSLVPSSISRTLRFGIPNSNRTLVVFPVITDHLATPTNIDIGPGSATQFNAANTYSGLTTVNGPLLVNNASALGTSTGDSDATIVNTGGILQTLGNTTIKSEKIIANGGNLSLATTGPVQVNASGELQGTFNGPISGNGDIHFQGNVNLNGHNTFTGNVFTANGENITANTTDAFGSTPSITLDAATLYLNAPIGQPIAIQSGIVNDNVNTSDPITVNGGLLEIFAPCSSPITFNNGSVFFKFADTAPITQNGGLLTIVAGSGLFTMNGGTSSIYATVFPITVNGGTATFANTTGSYNNNITIGGPGTTIIGAGAGFSQTLSLAGPAAIQGSLQLNNGISGNGDLSLGDSGNISISGNITTTGAIHFAGGNITINSANTFNTNVTLDAATTTFNANAVFNNPVTVTAGYHTFNANAQFFGLSITGGTIDTTSITLIVETTPASKSAILAALQQNIAVHSLISSTLPANFGLALIDNALLNKSTFGGLAVDSSSLVLAPELLGDANADNTVDLTDLSTVLNNFGQTTPNWTAGNFDHTPTIDLTDLSDVLNNFGLTNPNTSGLQITDYRLPAPTPEPATLLLAAPLLLRRTRKIRNREHICART